MIASMLAAVAASSNKLMDSLRIVSAQRRHDGLELIVFIMILIKTIIITKAGGLIMISIKDTFRKHTIQNINNKQKTEIQKSHI